MKTSAILRGGAVGGIVAALLLTTAGQALALNIPPWNWSWRGIDRYATAVEWARSAGVIAPTGVVLGIVAALACALVFEFVTHRSGWTAGAIVGLALGACGASAAGLIPWLASWYGYAYVPAQPPLGPHDPMWGFVAIALSGVIAGAVAGGWYGPPRHAQTPMTRWQWREIYPGRSEPDTRPRGLRRDAVRDRD